MVDVRSEKIDISGLEKWKVVAALYANAKPLGMGFLQYTAGPLGEEKAKRFAEECLQFDYLYGRLMKVDLKGDEFNPWLYDLDNGEGVARAAIEKLRSQGSIEPL